MMDARFGRYVNTNLAEYHVPVNADVPDIEVILVEEQDRLAGSHCGAKKASKTGCPRRSCKRAALPSSSIQWKSGARAPTGSGLSGNSLALSRASSSSSRNIRPIIELLAADR